MLPLRSNSLLDGGRLGFAGPALPTVSQLGFVEPRLTKPSALCLLRERQRRLSLENREIISVDLTAPSTSSASGAKSGGMFVSSNVTLQPLRLYTSAHTHLC
ncbi:hypothetical protein MRX96_038166 [Rhipicephalus microplus]